MGLTDIQKVFALMLILLVVVYVQRRWEVFGESPESFSTGAYAPAPYYSWEQRSAQQMNPKDSPWIWLEKQPSTQQVSQARLMEPEEKSSAQLWPVRKEDQVYDTLSPTERMQMMENMRQFRLESLEDDNEPVQL